MAQPDLLLTEALATEALSIERASPQAPFHPIASPAPAREAVAATVRIRLWDLPLRLFHWSLAVCVTAAIATGKAGGDWMVWHGRAGIAIVGLLAFRFVWGLIGPSPARFARFAPGPRRVLAYLQGRWRGIGHNPLGALSVFALLGLLGFQAGTGLVGNDDIAFTGPLAALISDETSHTLTNWHRLAINGLYVLIGLHLAAIAFYARIKRERLVAPMVTGWKDVPAELLAEVPPPKRARRIALLFALAAGVGAAYGAGGRWLASDLAKATASTAGPSATAHTASSPSQSSASSQAAPAW